MTRRRKPELPFLEGLSEDDLKNAVRNQAYMRYGLENQMDHWRYLIQHLAGVSADDVFTIQDAEEWLMMEHEELPRKCTYCGEGMIGRVRPGNQTAATWDHVVPLSLGGTDRKSNLVRACRFCNSSKGPHGINVWITQLEQSHWVDTIRERKRQKVIHRFKSGAFDGLIFKAIHGE